MPPIPGIAQSATIEVESQPLTRELNDRLTEVRVEQSYGAIGWFEFRLEQPDARPGNFKIGNNVRILFDDSSGKATAVVDGVISSLAIEIRYGQQILVVGGHDIRTKLGVAPHVRTFLNHSYKDVLEQIASESGVQAQIHSSLSNPVFDHLTQVVSDLDYVNDIARRTGSEVGVLGKKLIVGPRGGETVIELEADTDLRTFEARYTATETPERVTVRSWDVQRKKSIVVADSDSMESPSSEVPIEEASRGSSRGAATSWSRVSHSADEARFLAQGLATRMTAAALSGRGEVNGSPHLQAGVRCKLNGLGSDWNGTYFVVSATHLLTRDETYITRFSIGSSEHVGLLDLIDTSSSHSPTGRAPMGLTIGIVTANGNDEAANRDDLVKLKLPLLGDELETTWARIATIGGGDGRGVISIPEVNDEVLVAFEHGDLARPYVIGSLWSGPDKVPDGLTEDAEILIKSKVGHTLTFNGGSGDTKRNVVVKLAEGDVKLHVGQDKIEVIAKNGTPIEIKNDKGKVLIAGNGDITLSGQKVTIDAKGDVGIKGMNIKIEAQANLTLEATASLAAKGSASAKIESSGTTQVKGALVQVN